MLSCRRASRLQSDALERVLTVMERVELRGHLLMCAPCRRHQAQVLGMAALMREMRSRGSEHVQLTSEARKRIAVALRMRMGQ